MVSTLVGNEVPHKVLIGLYTFNREGSRILTNPKTYIESAAKGVFTREFRDQDFYQKHPERMSWKPSIYKHVGDQWICIFNPNSPAAIEYIEGRLTTQELRDLIKW